MWPKPGLKVVRIPCDGSPMKLTTIPLINIGERKMHEDECIDFEKLLEHIPNMKSVDNSKRFSWAYRKLVGIVNNNVGEVSWKADYMMYLCLDKRAGLPHNEELERLVKLGRGPAYVMDPFDVYGDAFVFRMEPQSKRQFDGPKRAVYTNMDTGFIEGVKGLDLYYGNWAFATLRKLLVCPQEG